jgi:hypothetical protein
MEKVRRIGLISGNWNLGKGIGHPFTQLMSKPMDRLLLSAREDTS